MGGACPAGQPCAPTNHTHLSSNQWMLDRLPTLPGLPSVGLPPNAITNKLGYLLLIMASLHRMQDLGVDPRSVPQEHFSFPVP